MRLIMIFAPAFFEWPKAICQALVKENPKIEIIALATTSRIRDQVQHLQDSGACSFIGIECFEDEAEKWLAAGYNEMHLKQLEDQYGSDLLNDILIADRHVGQGFITCADHVDSLLKLQTKDHDQKRAYIAGCAQFVSDLCNKYSPDAAYFYAVADADRIALISIMDAKGLKILRLTHSRIDNRYLLDTCQFGFFKDVDAAKGSASEEAMIWAKQWLQEYRQNTNKEPDYMVYLRDNTKNDLQLFGIAKNFVKACARAVLYPILKGKKPLLTETSLQRIRETIVIPYKAFASQKSFKSINVEERLKRPFIYYTLHVDPESSTTHLAPDHTNQLAVIEALAKRKPLHMDLLVKEHPNMIGRRPSYFYDAISKMPSVYLIPTSVPSSVLIQHAALIATITGTVAWEALLLQKPALLIGKSPHSEQELLAHGLLQHSDLSTFSSAITQALALKPVEDENIIKFLAVIYDQSFAFDGRLLWYSNKPEDIQDNLDVLDAMVNGILKFA